MLIFFERILLPMAGVGAKFLRGKLLSKSMTGRIVLSHVHVSTLRRTRSTEKLISSGLSSAEIITLE